MRRRPLRGSCGSLHWQHSRSLFANESSGGVAGGLRMPDVDASSCGGVAGLEAGAHAGVDEGVDAGRVDAISSSKSTSTTSSMSL